MWNVILGLATVLGFGLAAWQAMRAEQLNKRQRDLDWPRFRNAASDLARSVDRSGFMPDFILSISDRGAIVSNLVARELRRQIPIITVGYLDQADNISIPGFLTLCGTKVTTFLPEGLRDFKDKKALLLDDFVMSGDGLLRVKNQLLEFGFAADCIRSGSVVATKISIANRKGLTSLPGKRGISISSSHGVAPNKRLAPRSYRALAMRGWLPVFAGAPLPATRWPLAVIVTSRTAVTERDRRQRMVTDHAQLDSRFRDVPRKHFVHGSAD
jgi:hypoxanthine phosphoribosyltransferase